MLPDGRSAVKLPELDQDIAPEPVQFRVNVIKQPVKRRFQRTEIPSGGIFFPHRIFPAQQVDLIDEIQFLARQPVIRHQPPADSDEVPPDFRETRIENGKRIVFEQVFSPEFLVNGGAFFPDERKPDPEKASDAILPAAF